MSAGLPDGYQSVEVAGARGFAWSAAVPWLESVLHGDGTLESWAGVRTHDTRSGGRAPVLVVSAEVSGPDDRAQWAVRRYRRGGAAAALLGDRYVRAGRTRPAAELSASVGARARGVCTPAVVAGAVYPVGPFYRADLVTELVPDARTLTDALFGDDARADAQAALSAAGRLVRSLEEACVEHRDLNAGNIVLRSVTGGVEPWVLDLDRSRVLEVGSPCASRAMRGRLERSLTKMGHLYRRPLAPAEWEALRSGYGERT